MIRQIEEINLSKIAIKYSQNLKRDQVCTVLKRKFMLLAQDIGNGKELEMVFACGILTAKYIIIYLEILILNFIFCLKLNYMDLNGKMYII